MPRRADIPHALVINFVQPWPVAWRRNDRRRPWRVALLSMAEAAQLRVYWLDRPTAREAWRRIRTTDWLGKRHQVLSHSRHIVRPVVCVDGGRVVDGNHTLIACLAAKYRGPVLCFTRRSTR